MSEREDLNKAREANYIRRTIYFLKKTQAVTLAGQGGAYELLEKRIAELELDNPKTSKALVAAGSLKRRTHARHGDVHGPNSLNPWCCVATQVDRTVTNTCFSCGEKWPCARAGQVDVE